MLKYETHCGKLKRLDNGIQANCLADGGYTYEFCFHNKPIDPALLMQRYSPMHCRLPHMCQNLPFQFCQTCPCRLLVVQACSCSWHFKEKWSRLPSVCDSGAKVGGGAEATRRMMNAVGLKGDSMLSDLVVKSWYDQKLFLHDLIKVQEGIARSHHEECLVIKLQPNDRLYFPLLVPIP